MGDDNTTAEFYNTLNKYQDIRDSTDNIAKSDIEDSLNNNKIDTLSNSITVSKDSINYQLNENASIRFYKFSLVLLLSITALLSLWIILKYIKVGKNSDNLFRLSAIIVILFMLGVIVTIAEDTTQISAVVGLLGAIAGYFLKEGKEALEESSSENSTNNENSIDKP